MTEAEVKRNTLEILEAALPSMIKWLFQIVRVFWSENVPPGFVIKGHLNTPGNLPGYVCFEALGLVKYAWELV